MEIHFGRALILVFLISWSVFAQEGRDSPEWPCSGWTGPAPSKDDLAKARISIYSTREYALLATPNVRGGYDVQVEGEGHTAGGVLY